MVVTSTHGSETSKVRRFNRGEHLFHQGDTDRGVHRILAGIVTVYRLTADGYRQIEAFAGAGDYVSLCLSSTSPTSAEALSAVSTAFMSRRAFETRLLEDTAFRAKVFAEIDRATAEVRRQATQLACRSASQRVADFVLFMSHRFEKDATGFTLIPMSRADMADHLGLTLETVSRMLNRFKQHGLIDLPRADRFRVLDAQRMRAAAGGAPGMDSPNLATGS